jgi:hypothetical protein
LVYLKIDEPRSEILRTFVVWRSQSIENNGWKIANARHGFLKTFYLLVFVGVFGASEAGIRVVAHRNYVLDSKPVRR